MWVSADLRCPFWCICMANDELIKKCKFYHGGGDAEADAAYANSELLFTECWVAEDQWVKNNGSEGSLSIVQYVKKAGDFEAIPLSLRLRLAESLAHFDHNLFYEAPEFEFVSELRSLFSFYLNYNADNFVGVYT